MEEKNIREYARLMQELGLTGLEVRQDGSLRLEREGQPAPAPAAPQPAAAPEKAKPADGLTDVTSPMLEAITPYTRRVFYYETDKMAIVHNSNYLRIFEEARLDYMKDRKGGYTRILKMGFRQGDAADVVILELVDYKLPEPESKDAKAAKKAAPKADAAVAEKKAPAKKAPAKKAAADKTKKAAADKAEAGKE